jgi:hypothetical protein
LLINKSCLLSNKEILQMLDISYSPPTEAQIRAVAEYHVQKQKKELIAIGEKELQITLPNGKKHKIIIKIDENGIASVYVVKDSVSDGELVKPRLQLNIGAFLLPEAIDLGIPAGAGYNPSADNTEGAISIGYTETTNSDATAIMDYIKAVGLRKLLLS